MKGVLLVLVVFSCVLIVGFWLVAALVLDSADHSAYDLPAPQDMGDSAGQSAGHQAAATAIRQGLESPPSEGDALELMRAAMDARGAATEIRSVVRPVAAAGVSGEWVLPPVRRTGRRLLYIHGGGYVMGSAKSHRRITDRLARLAQAAVFAVDYRLMPEHSRRDGIDDVHAAYQWLLDNGPEDGAELNRLMVAGDSAGANLALSTIAWARDLGLRSADAVIAMSPQTDATFGSPSLVRNIDTDIMQGASFGPLVKAPRAISLWVSAAINRVNPSNPIVSPLLGDLSNLPPTLLQVSRAEMFFDDVVRYGNKANAHGSYALVQSWPELLHVWQAFDVPEADAAFIEIESFLAQHAPPII